MPRMHIALIHPEIAPNTGNIGRLCLGVGATLHLVHPLGFSTSEKAVRRAGLDYWRHVSLREHEDLPSFWRWVGDRPAHLFSTKGEGGYLDCPYAPGDVLVFGCESRGLSEALVAERGAWRIPVDGPVRSLNLSNAVAVIAYAALHRITVGAPGKSGEGA